MTRSDRIRARLDAAAAAFEKARADDNRFKTPATAAARAKALVELQLANMAATRMMGEEFGV